MMGKTGECDFGKKHSAGADGQGKFRETVGVTYNGKVVKNSIIDFKHSKSGDDGRFLRGDGSEKTRRKKEKKGK